MAFNLLQQPSATHPPESRELDAPTTEHLSDQLHDEEQPKHVHQEAQHAINKAIAGPRHHKQRATETPKEEQKRLASQRIRSQRYRDKKKQQQQQQQHEQQSVASPSISECNAISSAYDRVHNLVCPPLVDSHTWTAPSGGWEGDLHDATKIAEYFDQHMPQHVCAVCGVYRGRSDLSVLNLDQAPVHLLLAEKASEALTVCRIMGIDYCLAPEGVLCSDKHVEVLHAHKHIDVTVCVDIQDDIKLQFCSNCLPSLLNDKLPRYSMSAFDAGRVPNIPDLLPLSPIEELIVAPLRVNRLTIIARPAGMNTAGRNRDTFNSYLQSHVVAIPNVSLETWAKLVMPLQPDQLTDFVDVVILASARDSDEAKRMAERVRCAQIRPKVIVAWVKWLLPIYQTLYPDLHFEVDQEALQYYESTHDISVPVSLQENAHVVSDEAEAEQAANLAAGLQAGYANTRPPPVDSPAHEKHMPDVDLDCSTGSPAVLVQLKHEVVTQILHCYPCVLHIPERPNPIAPDVLLPACSVVVSSIDATDGFLKWAMEMVDESSTNSLYAQLDAHIKQVVRSHQLGSVDTTHHMAGIEDISIMVEIDNVVRAELPTAIQEIYADVKVNATPAHSAGSGNVVDDDDQLQQPSVPRDDTTNVDAMLHKIRRVFEGHDTQGKVGVIATAGHLFPDMDTRWPALTHPSAFPYGVGTPPPGMSYDAWLPVILQRAPRQQFAEQPMLVLDMFNITQRHEVNRAAKQVLYTNDRALEEFACLTVDELVLVVELFEKKHRGKDYTTALATAPLPVQKFLRALRQISNKVRGSPGYYSSARSQAFAL